MDRESLNRELDMTEEELDALAASFEEGTWDRSEYGNAVRATVILADNELPMPKKGMAVSAETIASWVDPHESGMLPEGYAFDGPVRPGHPE